MRVSGQIVDVERRELSFCLFWVMRAMFVQRLLVFRDRYAEILKIIQVFGYLLCVCGVTKVPPQSKRKKKKAEHHRSPLRSFLSLPKPPLRIYHTGGRRRVSIAFFGVLCPPVVYFWFPLCYEGTPIALCCERCCCCAQGMCARHTAVGLAAVFLF